jgi:hypothetical protein
MLGIKINGRWRSWWLGDSVPELERVQEFQADGDELNLFATAMDITGRASRHGIIYTKQEGLTFTKSVLKRLAVQHALTPKQGAVAYCSRNELGLITSVDPLTVTYKKCPMCLSHEQFTRALIHNVELCKCETGLAWCGIHLSPEKFGQPWSSRNPRVIAKSIQELLP